MSDFKQVKPGLAAPLTTLNIVVAGTGKVGAEFLRLLVSQQQRFAGQIRLNLCGILNSRLALLSDTIESQAWSSAFSDAKPYQQASLVAYLAALPSPKVLIDITPSQDFARLYPAFIAAGCHLISANKQGVTLPGAEYQQILQALVHSGLRWLSNTTVGAGIPVQRVMQELLQSGDQILEVSGVFSGTLSWLLCQYDGTTAFSELVLQAQQLGYTEPDPRDDLSGKDVQRKLLVLARELGAELELADIELEPLLPAGLADGDLAGFWQQRQHLDLMLAEAYAKANAENKVLRYAASLRLAGGQVQAGVRLVAVDNKAPLAALAPCDNIFVITSDWYQQNPLVLKGPGAGLLVTAGGLHADLAELVKSVRLNAGMTWQLS